MKTVLILLVSLTTISVSAKKIDFSGAIEQSHQERIQTAEQIKEYLAVGTSHMQERQPQAEAKKNLFRGVSSTSVEIKHELQPVQLIADVNK